MKYWKTEDANYYDNWSDDAIKDHYVLLENTKLGMSAVDFFSDDSTDGENGYLGSFFLYPGEDVEQGMIRELKEIGINNNFTNMTFNEIYQLYTEKHNAIMEKYDLS